TRRTRVRSLLAPSGRHDQGVPCPPLLPPPQPTTSRHRREPRRTSSCPPPRCVSGSGSPATPFRATSPKGCRASGSTARGGCAPPTSARPGWPSAPWTPHQTWRNIAPSTPRAWRVRAGRPLLSRRYITIVVVDNAEPYACPRRVARGEVEVRADARRRSRIGPAVLVLHELQGQPERRPRR